MTLITVSTPTDPLVAYGAKAAGTPSLLRDGYQPPQPGVVVGYVPPAPFIDGEDPITVRSPNAVLGLKVRIEGSSEAAHDLIVALWRTALRQLVYEVTVQHGDRTTRWQAIAGQMTLTDGAREPIIAGAPVVDYYTISIPVLPNPLEVS